MMNKFSILIILILTIFIFPQQKSPIYVTGSVNDISMNPIFSPDGKKIAFTKAKYEGIYIYDLTTKNIKKVTDEQAAGFGYKWSSDSKSILARVAKYENMKRLNAVKVFNVDSDQQLQLTEYRTRMPFMPEWSDQDTKVILPSKNGVEVYNSGKLNKTSSNVPITDIYIKNDKITTRNAATNKEKFLEPIKDAQIINLVASPDKKKVAFEVMGGNLYSMNTDGTGLIDLGIGHRPRWSFDSKKIIYMITEDNGEDYTASDIFTINADGTQKKNLTNTNDRIEMNPCFSPDGKTIVYDVYNDGSIYLMNIE